MEKPDEDDYRKLLHVDVVHLQGMVSLPLTLEADESNNLHWWIDGAFTNHMDMRSHTGGTLSLGKRCWLCDHIRS